MQALQCTALETASLYALNPTTLQCHVHVTGKACTSAGTSWVIQPHALRCLGLFGHQAPHDAAQRHLSVPAPHILLKSNNAIWARLG